MSLIVSVITGESRKSPALLFMLTVLFMLASVFALTGCQKDSAPDPASVSSKTSQNTSTDRKQKKPVPDENGLYHIHPGDDLQRILDAAASDAKHKDVVIHAGTYRPAYSSQAMIRFHARHDGIVLRADGEVTLTAENRDLSIPGTPGYPAIVNHVIYIGHGVTSRTKLVGLQVTGANGFVTQSEDDGPIEPASDKPGLDKRLFFYLDGGAIKIFGDSSPVLDGLRIFGNRTLLCGAGISVEQRGLAKEPVVIQNCRFEDNACPATGTAIDLLEGSKATITNCLFRNNIGNTGMAAVASQYGLKYHETHGSGALTVFPGSSACTDRCTFTRNWNAVDDHGSSVYTNCIFYDNTASDGSLPGAPYEMDVADTVKVEDCWLKGTTDDLRGTIDATHNRLQAPDPDFDEHFQPRNPEYKNAGWRKP